MIKLSVFVLFHLPDEPHSLDKNSTADEKRPSLRYLASSKA